MKTIFKFAFFLSLSITSSMAETQESILKTLSSKVSKSYPRYNETTHLLKLLEETFPNQVKIYSIGKSVLNKEMWVIKLGENLSKPKPILVPKVKMVGNMHGDETLGRALILMLAVDILKKFTKENKRIVKLLKTTEIHLLPTMNPDGFEVSVESDCNPNPYNLGRLNANLKDLNRDFPDQFNTKMGQTIPELLEKRQPETRNIMNWILSNKFVLSANFHALKLVASYPFDSVPLEIENQNNYYGSGIISKAPDHEFFFKLAKTYAEAHKRMSTEGCEEGEFENGVINGAEWYNVKGQNRKKKGGMQDFNYVYSNCFEITFELSCCKFPGSSTLLDEWRDNEEALYKYIEAAQSGVKGIVSDINGKPLNNAKIHVEGIKKEIESDEFGAYWRLLLSGSYRIWASHQSYKTSEKIEVVVPPNNESIPVVVNFKLEN